MTSISSHFFIQGNMVMIHHQGVLLVGAPGVGKSSTTLHLLHRQQHFIADDGVDIVLEKNQLIARSPKSMRGYLFVRGFGFIDVPQQFGKSAHRESAPLHVIIELTTSNTRKRSYQEILGKKVLRLKMPTRDVLNVIEQAGNFQ